MAAQGPAAARAGEAPPAATAPASTGPRGPLVKVTVRRGDIFRRFSPFHFVKMNPYVEVLLGETLVGTVPAAMGADLQPVWNHQLQAQEFELGQELNLRVLDRNKWPRKDVLVGTGSVKLTAELLRPERRCIEQAVQLQKKHAGEPKPEVTGSVSVSMTFTAQQPAQAAVRPLDVDRAESAGVPLPPPFGSPVPTPTSTATGPRGIALQPEQPPVQNNRQAQEQSQPPAGQAPDDASVASSSCRPSNANAPAAIDPALAEKRRRLVAQQYYGREVRQQSWQPVLCTEGVQLLWQRWRCTRSAFGCYACAGGAVAAAWVVQLIC